MLQVLEHKISRLQKEQVDQEGTILTNTREHLQDLMREREILMDFKNQGARLRSAAKWAIDGEKPSKYFLNLEKTNALKRTIYRLKDSLGNEWNNQADVLTQIRNYYYNLYTSRGKTDLSYLDTLQLPKLPVQTRDELDGLLTQKELSQAIYDLKNNKSPGPDGIPVDLIKVFFPKLQDFLWNLYLEICEAGELHLTARRGIISLLEKLGKDGLFLKNWRPLSLLNADYKIFSKILANRLKHALPHVIHHSQTGFMQGRYMAEGIMKIQEIMQTCDLTGTDGIVISFDFKKAFDTVEWTAIYATLEAYGFGSKFINMVKILYNNPLACTYNNGYWSDWFKLTRSTRQG